MKLDQLSNSLPAMYYASLDDGGPAFHIESSPGRGKTSVITKFPVIMKRANPAGNYGVSVINGACFNMFSAMGFMIWQEDTHGRTISKFTEPTWMFTAEGKHMSEYDGGVLLIDEADKLSLDEKKIVGEAALSKILGGHKLPPGWIVMFAANRMSDKSGSTRDLMHLVNRRITLGVTDDVEAWVTWALGEKLLPETIQFGEENPQLLFEPLPEDMRPFCTPRSLHQCDIYLRSLMASYDTDKIPTDPLTMEAIAGGIGKPAAAQLSKTIRLGQELVSYEEIIAHPSTVTLPNKPDAMRLMAYKVASRVTVAEAKQALTFVARMPMEHQCVVVRMAIQRHYQLAFEPTFAQWCGKHTQLIAILNRYRVQDK